MVMRRFDVVVIGSGVAGQTVAADCAASGLSTAVVDRLPFGGTCAQRGCEPKKVLLGGVDALDAVRRLAGRGPAGDVRLDWAALQAFKRTYTDPVPARTEQWMSEAGITTIHGTAAFVSPDAIAVDGEVIRAESLVIATGAYPRPLGIEGEELVATSDVFLALDELPARIAFLGGGYISFELAHIASTAGADVTIAHSGPSPLGGFDPTLVGRLVDGYRESGIAVLLDAPVTAVRAEAGALVVEAGGQRLPCDLAIHGAGRVPDLGSLDLAAGGVAYGPHGVEVGPDLRSTTNPRVFACGDASSRGLPLTPVGTRQGAAIARTLAGATGVQWDDAVTPSVVFSSPPLARVGLGEHEARSAGRDIEVLEHDTTGWFTSTRLGVPRSGAKIVIERESGLILGAHLLGDAAEEVINLFALAIATGATAGMLKRLPLAYPTAGSDLSYLL